LLESLRRQEGVEVELIVVDRNSIDESAAILSVNPDVIVVKERPETGLVTGYAVGAEHATADLVFFCNEDMWFDSRCLLLLARRIDPSLGIVAADPWQWTYDGSVWIHGGVRFRRARLDLNSPFPFRGYDFTVPLEAGTRIPFGCAGAVMIDRSAYRDVGGWDRGFFLDHEDIDLFLRIWRKGWKCVTVPESKVFHAVNVSNAKSISGGQRVSRRRYISGRSSLPILALKYFSSAYAVLPFTSWAAATCRHLLALDWTRAWWHVLAGREILRRAGQALDYRRRTSDLRRRCPGEAFFLVDEFQASKPALSIESHAS